MCDSTVCVCVSCHRQCDTLVWSPPCEMRHVIATCPRGYFPKRNGPLCGSKTETDFRPRPLNVDGKYGYEPPANPAQRKVAATAWALALPVDVVLGWFFLSFIDGLGTYSGLSRANTISHQISEQTCRDTDVQRSATRATRRPEPGQCCAVLPPHASHEKRHGLEFHEVHPTDLEGTVQQGADDAEDVEARVMGSS